MLHSSRFTARRSRASWRLAAPLAAVVRLAAVALLAPVALPWALGAEGKVEGESGEKGEQRGAPRRPPAALHGEKCDSCQASDIWKRFLAHLRASGREDLIPAVEVEPAPEAEVAEESGDRAVEKPARVDLQANDTIRGILFRLSSDFVNLDALFAETEGKPLGPDAAGKANELAAKLRAGEDPFLKAYGEFYGARLDLEAGRHPSAVKALDGLVNSCNFLPRREARRYLAKAHRGAGDDTLAVLELQFFLLDLPVENQTDRVWAGDELRSIRDRKHPGPLQDSEASMRSISELLVDAQVGEATQASERRVEDILFKVAKLLERPGGT